MRPKVYLETPVVLESGMDAKRQGNWLPDMDLNHDKQIQSLLCYRYTIGQMSASKVKVGQGESRLLKGSTARPERGRRRNLVGVEFSSESLPRVTSPSFVNPLRQKPVPGVSGPEHRAAHSILFNSLHRTRCERGPFALRLL